MRIEYSKLIFWLVLILTVCVTVFGCVLMWKTGDTSGLAYIIPAVFTELATATGFYFWKAKNENIIKLKKKHKLDVTDEDIER